MSGAPQQRRLPSPSTLSNKFHASVGSESSTPVVGTSLSRKLLKYDEIPSWHQDNEHIRSGYRPETHSTKLCFASWSYIHNETANIYSHLLPAIAALVCETMLYRFFQVRYPTSTTGDQLVFAFFLLAAAACLGVSVTYHTLMNHSASVSNLWLRIDYIGIVILTLGDFVSGIYLIFYREPMLQKVYWTMVSILPRWPLVFPMHGFEPQVIMSPDYYTRFHNNRHSRQSEI